MAKKRETANVKRVTYTLTGYYDVGEHVSMKEAMDALDELKDKAIEMGGVSRFVANIPGGEIDLT